MITLRKRGSVMMETVLILPWFLLVVFGVVQFSFLWVARLMTDYAAFCAARAALVYNPADAACDKATNVSYRAARQVLAWMSFSQPYTRDGDAPTVPGWGTIPLSDAIDDQLTVTVEDCGGGKGFVTATVRFEFPLFVPVVSTLVPKMGKRKGSGLPSVPISSSCTLPRPWETKTWPLRTPAKGGSSNTGGGNSLGASVTAFRRGCVCPSAWPVLDHGVIEGRSRRDTRSITACLNSDTLRLILRPCLSRTESRGGFLCLSGVSMGQETPRCLPLGNSTGRETPGCRPQGDFMGKETRI